MGSTQERERGECEVDAVRLRGEAVERRRTHSWKSPVSWPMKSGMGPVSWLLSKFLRMCAQRKR